MKMSQALECRPSYLQGFDDETVQMMDVAKEKGEVFGNAFTDPNQLHLLKTYQSLNEDNQGKLIQFADALALLP